SSWVFTSKPRRAEQRCNFRTFHIDAGLFDGRREHSRSAACAATHVEPIGRFTFAKRLLSSLPEPPVAFAQILATGAASSPPVGRQFQNAAHGDLRRFGVLVRWLEL